MAGLTDSGVRSAAKDARALAEDSLDRTPDSYQARVALGVALIAQGELDDARTDLDRAVALFPERPDAYVQRAIARYGLGDVPGARADLLRAQRITPRSTTVRRLLASIDQG
jgi:Flp pilus assembly protein TadD